MKETKMRMSGVVYVKDPRDIDLIRKLRANLQESRNYARSLEKYKKQVMSQEVIKKKEKQNKDDFEMIKRLVNELQRIKKFTLGSFLDPSYNDYVALKRRIRKHGKKS